MYEEESIDPSKKEKEIFLQAIARLEKSPLGEEHPDLMSEVILCLKTKRKKTVLLRPLVALLGATHLNGLYYQKASSSWLRVETNHVVEIKKTNLYWKEKFHIT